VPRYRITLAYDGTEFHGWQRQTAAEGGPLRTVQHVLERAVWSTIHERVPVLGASRTDAGVHARGQVAAFTCQRRVPVSRLPMALTSALPKDVLVHRAEEVHELFDPISDAVCKGYTYRIAHGKPPFWPDLFRRREVHRSWIPLNAFAMDAAAQALVGTHDFAAFAKAGHGRESTVRRVLRCAVIEEDANQLRVEIAGTGFLHNMVRIIAGTLVDVGRGRLAPDEVAAILASGDRSRAGQTLPANGLCLMWIEYPNPVQPVPAESGDGPGADADSGPARVGASPVEGGSTLPTP
jgi:tRNA pseudouridine38-40 synthase